MNRQILMRGLALVLSLITLCLVTYFGAPYFRSTAIPVLEWVDSLGFWAPVAFVVISAIAVPLVLPGFLFSLGAGFMFGFATGLVLLWLSINIGAAGAFLIGRHAGSARFIKMLAKHGQLEQINEVLLQKGWRVVMLTRFIPMFPFKLSNYVFGMAGFSLKDFWLGNAIGIIPLCALNVYIGSLAGTLSELGTRERPLTTTELFAYSMGFFVLALGMLYLAFKARDALHLGNENSDSSAEVESNGGE